VSLATRRLLRLWIWAVAAAVAVVDAGVPGEAPDLNAAAASERVRGGAPEVSCAACFVVDDRNRVLFARAADERRSNASTTKMVTALIVRRSSALSEEVDVSAEAASTGAGGLDLQPGDRFSVEELLHAMLLSSSNDAAVALAEHVAGTEAAFVRKMNRFARSMGANETHFVTAHGLDAPDHYSSARDLAAIGARVLQDRILAAIVATPSTVIEGPGRSETLENRNLLLEAYRGAIGIKTGFTSQAGNVLVAAARRSGHTIIAVAMGSVDATADAAALLDFGWDRLKRTVLVPMGTGVGGVVWAFGGATGIVASAPVRGLADPSSLQVAFEPAGGDGPVEAGEPVGRIVVMDGDRRIGAVTAVASDTVTVNEPPWPAAVASSLLRIAARAIGRL
jgi:D-alanyl-D-alanine carboxypeptidase (penicillin-binding protein 5/6)